MGFPMRSLEDCHPRESGDPYSRVGGTGVMAGLVPAIHVFSWGTKDVDARAKRGHDERESDSI
jgi:hypothetical protein